MFRVPYRGGEGLVQSRRLRPLNGPIRHPQKYSKLQLGAMTYGKLLDFLTKLIRSPTVKYVIIQGAFSSGNYVILTIRLILVIYTGLIGFNSTFRGTVNEYQLPG